MKYFIEIRNDNTVSATNAPLTAQAVGIKVPTALPLDRFCKFILMDNPAQGQVAHVPVLTAIQATVENPASYEASGDTFSHVGPTQVSLSQQFGQDAPSKNRGLTIAMQFESAVSTLTATADSKIAALFTAANFGDADSEPAATFAKGNLQTMLASVANKTVLGLGTAHHAKAEPTWFPPGTEKLLVEVGSFTGAESGTVGFVAGSNAIALPYGFSKAGPLGSEIKTSTFILPNGLPVMFSQWFALGGRSWRASLDVIIAPAVGQSGALRLLKSA